MTIGRPEAVMIWALDTFGRVATREDERAMRFAEEAIELCHALGMNSETLDAIITRVWERDQGEVKREIGQSQMTLEALAYVLNIDADAEADKEFSRVQSIPKEEWTKRHSAKVLVGIAK